MAPLDALISIPKHKLHKRLSKKCRAPGPATSVVQKNDIRAGCPTSSKNCSLNRDVECLSVGTIFALSFSERSAMAAHLQLPRKKAPSPTDQHIGARVR